MKEIKFKRMHFLQRLVINAITLLALAGFFSQGLHIDSIFTAFIAALILGVLNALVRPVLQLLALPLTILTFGLFGLIVNGTVLWLTAAIVGKGFQFTSFGWAVLISIIMWLVNLVVSNYLARND
ncbi:putative membrane protein [Weissella oryzae SG25]|uniref:Putative membrane protein n=1 Tax=Weissella oryzae (strain DSM 25784 / JCM 18191 / LMG 30913 / SG25) TaxID=1329250 RepID=A0A069D247_WEIOS|nr:phage holin family protein [Weissella oryzae]GAK31466.1 putative membrane protein [Weissella oryzae SG25]